MSKKILLISENIIVKEQVFQLAEGLGGYRLVPPPEANTDVSQAVVEYYDGTIWVELVEDIPWYKEEIAIMEQRGHKIEVKSIVTIIVGTASEISGCIALKYCKRFLLRFSKSFLYYDTYPPLIYTGSEVLQMHCDIDGNWWIGGHTIFGATVTFPD